MGRVIIVVLFEHDHELNGRFLDRYDEDSVEKQYDEDSVEKQLTKKTKMGKL